MVSLAKKTKRKKRKKIYSRAERERERPQEKGEKKSWQGGDENRY